MAATRSRLRRPSLEPLSPGRSSPSSRASPTPSCRAEPPEVTALPRRSRRRSRGGKAAAAADPAWEPRCPAAVLAKLAAERAHHHSHKRTPSKPSSGLRLGFTDQRCRSLRRLVLVGYAVRGVTPIVCFIFEQARNAPPALPSRRGATFCFSGVLPLYSLIVHATGHTCGGACGTASRDTAQTAPSSYPRAA